MISHPWRGLLRINKATFNNNSFASWRADLDLHPGRAAREDWRVVHRDQLLQLLLYLHRGRQAAAELGLVRGSCQIPQPYPWICQGLPVTGHRQMAGEAKRKGGHCATPDSVAYPHTSSPFLLCIVSWPINIHKSLSIVFALFYHARRPDSYLP